MAGPRVAYILLWFPEPSQTFVPNEVNTLARLGLDLKVYTLYGPRPPDRVAAMAPPAAPVRRLGLAAAGMLMKELVQLRSNWGSGAGRFLAGSAPPLALPGDRRRGPLGGAGRGVSGPAIRGR